MCCGGSQRHERARVRLCVRIERRVYIVCVFLAATLDSYVSPEASRSERLFRVGFFFLSGCAFSLNLDRVLGRRKYSSQRIFFYSAVYLSAYLLGYLPVFYLYFALFRFIISHFFMFSTDLLYPTLLAHLPLSSLRLKTNKSENRSPPRLVDR